MDRNRMGSNAMGAFERGPVARGPGFAVIPRAARARFYARRGGAASPPLFRKTR